MARNGSGTYNLPAGQPVVTGTTISSTTFNTLTADLATALTQSISADGQTPITGPLRSTNGTAGSCSYSWTASAGTGLYSPATDEAAMAAGGVQIMKWTGTGTSTALPIVSTLAIGTAPFTITSTTRVANLNVATAGTADTATAANGLKTATTTVVVSAATAPNNGDVLTASSSTQAAWVAPAAGVSLSGTNTWTGAQTFTNSLLKLLGSSTGKTIFTSANSSASDYTITIPAVTSTMATLAANTYTGLQTFLNTKETVHTISDGAAFEIDPANGNVQVVTLGASRTPKATNLAAGQSVLLGIDDGTAYTITWTDATLNPTWVKSGGTAAAPALATTGYTWVLLWKAGSTMYGAIVGSP